jgi:DnaJ-class molecular chaperone
MSSADRPDLYEELGVDRDADAAAIKRAHRKAAKRTHPDVEGGDRDEFERIQHAYMVLSDPDMRARYDRGDDINQQRPPIEVQAVSVLCEAFNNAMQQVDDIIHDDIMAVTRDLIGEGAKRVRNQRDHIIVVIDKLETIIGRLKAKGERDFIGNALRDQLNDARRGLEQLEEQIKVHMAAAEMTKDFEYQVDEREPIWNPSNWDRPTTLTLEDYYNMAQRGPRRPGGPFVRVDPGA